MKKITNEHPPLACRNDDFLDSQDAALQLPVTVQLVISDTTTGHSCWQATFPIATRQQATYFGAKGP